MSRKAKIAMIVTSVVLAFVTLLVFAVCVTVLLLKNNGIYLYFGSFDSQEILSVTEAVSFALFCLTAVMLLLSFRKTKILGIVAAALLILPVIVVLGWSLPFDQSFSPNYNYYTLTSPDGRHEIIVKEETFLSRAHGNFYEKTSRFTMQKTGDYYTDEWPTIGEETYEVEWLEDGFRIRYYYGNGAYKKDFVPYAE